MSNYKSDNQLSRYAANAIFGIGGGIALFVINMLLRRIIWPVGLAIGIVVTILGILGILSTTKADRKGGFIALAAGIVLLFAFRGIGPVRAIAGTILSAGGFASLGLGIWNGIRFLLGVKERT